MQIGIVAKKIGLSVDAIRFYERNALLPRPPRTQGGSVNTPRATWRHSLFSPVQGLGFKLSEIRALLRLRGNRFSRVRRCAAGLEEKLSDVTPEAYRPSQAEHELRLALRSCNRELRKRPLIAQF